MSSADGTTIQPPDWAAIRAQFPTTEKFAYLDIARKAILPQRTQDDLNDWMSDVFDDAGAHAFSMEGVEHTRRNVAKVFGAPVNNVALIKNTSEGINIVAQGFPWREGDNVVISEFEHENNTFPWRHLAQRGVEVRWATPDESGRVTVERYRALVDARTRILACAWVVYGNGYRADMDALSEFCRERGIRLVVDGIQAVGVLATPVSELGADVVVAGGHKAQLSLAGAGFMYANTDMIQLLRPPYAAKFSFTSNDRMQTHLELAEDAHRFEYGNPNFLGCWVQGRSAQYLAQIGLKHIEQRVCDLSTYLIEQATLRQLTVRTPRPWAQRAGIVSLNIGDNATHAVGELRKQGIVVSEKDGHLRAAVHFYNNEHDIDRFLDALQAI